MIIREVIPIVNSSIDYEYEETDIKIDEEI